MDWSRTYLAFVSLSICGFAGVLSPAGVAETPAKPNVILIMADDLGYECLESYGGVTYRTPHLSRLADEGMQFDRCYSQPLCTPSRVQIMTGLYNVRNYMNWVELESDQRTFGHLMQERGYATLIAGKWQLSGGRAAAPSFGFDEHLLWWVDTKSERYMNAGEMVLNGESCPGGKGEYGPDIVNDYILDFIERKRDEPFFVYYPMMLPHAPFTRTPLSDTRNPDQSEQRYFKDMVEYMDLLVGRLLSHLDQLGLREKTLVLFTGDNGTNVKMHSSLADGSLIPGGKGETINDASRVPLLATWPGLVASGTRSDGLIDFADFFATLDHLTSDTGKAKEVSDGISFLPRLKGKEKGGRDWTYCWYAKYPEQDEPLIFALSQRYKLYQDSRFFDTLEDPFETRPIPTNEMSDQGRKAQRFLQKIIDRYQDARP